MTKYKLTIEGMHCASCGNNIERGLKKVSGVKEVSASVMTKKAFVEAEGDISEDVMKQAVAKIGYKVLSIEKQ